MKQAYKIDDYDRAILRVLQKNANLNIDQIAEKVLLSRNACWRRIKQLEQSGVIDKKVALISPQAVNLSLLVFVFIHTDRHTSDWLKTFNETVNSMPEIIGAHRMAGELDYVLQVRLKTVQSYDEFYQRLIAKLPVAKVSASFVMENIKSTTELPL